MASVPITVLSYNGPLLCGFNMGIKGLNNKYIFHTIFQYYRYCIISATSVFRYIDIVLVASEISVIFLYFITLFRLFNNNLQTNNYVSKIKYLILQCNISLHLY